MEEPPIQQYWINKLRSDLDRGGDMSEILAELRRYRYSEDLIHAAREYAKTHEIVKPEIIMKHHYISDVMCDRIIADLDREHPIPLGVMKKQEGNTIKNEMVDKRVTQRLYFKTLKDEVVSLFKQICLEQLEPFYHAEIESFESPQLLYYTAGGSYFRHSDADRWDETTRTWEKILNRDYSIILYLNSEFEGGHLNLDNFGIRITPEKGLLVCFPSDHRYVHQAETILSGERYCIVSWTQAKGVPLVSTQSNIEVERFKVR